MLDWVGFSLHVAEDQNEKVITSGWSPDGAIQAGEAESSRPRLSHSLRDGLCASVSMRVALVERGCRAIPHLDADTGLDLGRTRKGESVHDSLAHDR